VENCTDSCADEDDSTYNSFFEVGTLLRVRWGKDELGNSGWRPGWYVAEVQGADVLEDTVDVVYVSEPESIYNIDVTEFLAQGKLQLA
jgi:hypothetical protein